MTRSAPRNAEATKKAITSAARKQFAELGFQRATLRAIASDAGVDAAMIARYFGSKDGLFASAADFDLRMPDLSTVPARSRGRRLAEHFLDRWEEDETFTALLRTAVTHRVAHDRLLDVFENQVVAIVGQLTGDDSLTRERAGMIASQIWGIALCRYVLALPPVAGMSRDELVDWLSGTLQRYLTK